jgi:hypothetical protein
VSEFYWLVIIFVPRQGTKFPNLCQFLNFLVYCQSGEVLGLRRFIQVYNSCIQKVVVPWWTTNAKLFFLFLCSCSNNQIHIHRHPSERSLSVQNKKNTINRIKKKKQNIFYFLFAMVMIVLVSCSENPFFFLFLLDLSLLMLNKATVKI